MPIKAYPFAHFKALEEQGEGVFEALVAVFNNVDRYGDRILPGAFANTLKRWAESGDPIPVIYAHEWDNLDAHIGKVLEAKETEDGLYVKAQLDMDEEFAQRVWKKMKARTLKQFSFAYDVVDSQLVDEGQGGSHSYVNELKELDLLEVGPCLVGVNPETELIAIKNVLAAYKAGARHTTKEFEQIQQIHDLAAALGAKCAEPAGDTGGEGDGDDGGKAREGTSDGWAPGYLATQVALDLIEFGIGE